jgi:hypothetical protein
MLLIRFAFCHFEFEPTFQPFDDGARIGHIARGLLFFNLFPFLKLASKKKKIDSVIAADERKKKRLFLF